MRKCATSIARQSRWMKFGDSLPKKQRRVTLEDSLELGDIWTFIAVDADSKIVPCYKVGKRDHDTATEFVCDLASRLNHRIQLLATG